MTETAKTKIGKVKELGKERLQEQKSIWAEAIEAGKEAIKKEKEFFTKKGEKEEAV